MIYLKVNHRSQTSFSFKWLKEGTLYKVESSRVTPTDYATIGTYYGFPKFYFDEISSVEALIECHKQGCTIESIQELK